MNLKRPEQDLVLQNYNAHEMLNTVRYAEKRSTMIKQDWNKIVERAMNADFHGRILRDE